MVRARGTARSGGLFLSAAYGAHHQPWGYLVGDISDNIGKFLHDKVDTLEAGLFQPGNLFLYNGLEGHVGGKKANSDA